MMKHISVILLMIIAVWRCSSSIDTTDFGPEDQLKHAISLYEDEDYEDALNEFQSILLQFPSSSVPIIC